MYCNRRIDMLSHLGPHTSYVQLMGKHSPALWRRNSFLLKALLGHLLGHYNHFAEVPWPRSKAKQHRAAVRRSDLRKYNTTDYFYPGTIFH